MSEVQAAIYARVSSERQASEHTIASQVTALQDRVTADGLRLPAALQFIDDGYSGSTLLRPSLEQLRDAAAAGRIDRVSVHAPDRLARSYAHQVLLAEELRSCGVDLEFLNRPLGRTAKDELLLQVQGIIAEYERANVLSAATATVARWSGSRDSRCGTVTIAVRGMMPIGRMDSASVRTSPCEQMRPRPRCGRRSAASWKIRLAWRRNISAAFEPKQGGSTATR